MAALEASSIKEVPKTLHIGGDGSGGFPTPTPSPEPGGGFGGVLKKVISDEEMANLENQSGPPEASEVMGPKNPSKMTGLLDKMGVTLDPERLKKHTQENAPVDEFSNSLLLPASVVGSGLLNNAIPEKLTEASEYLHSPEFMGLIKKGASKVGGGLLTALGIRAGLKGLGGGH